MIGQMLGFFYFKINILLITIKGLLVPNIYRTKGPVLKSIDLLRGNKLSFTIISR